VWDGVWSVPTVEGMLEKVFFVSHWRCGGCGAMAWEGSGTYDALPGTGGRRFMNERL